MEASQRLLVRGRVHQVGYRDWVVRKALALGCTGWVRNLTDGRVEILASGPSDALAALVNASHEGPQLAYVEDVEAFQTDDRPCKGFTKRFTASAK